MRTLALDIETVGVDFDSLDESARAYLLRSAEGEPTEELREAARARVRESLSLWPLTAGIVAVALVNVDTGGARVYYVCPEPEEWPHEEGRCLCQGSDEKTVLERFWRDVAHYQRVVTFNGRGFDLPFLMLRSAIRGVRPSRNLMGNRYDARHIDLLDQLTFYGATRRFSLEFYCQAFGIESPKAGGVRGSDVAALYREGRHREIASYCLRDTVATARLYQVWHKHLAFEGEPGP